jgi:hypothetical protein
MATQVLTGNVTSGNGPGVPTVFTGPVVTLYFATEGTPQPLGSAENIDGFTIEFTVPEGDGIYYAAADWSRGSAVVLVNVIGPEIQGPIIINELTTVAAAYAFAQFVENGQISGNLPGLGIAWGMSENLASSRSGYPGDVMTASPNADETNSLQALRTLANVLRPCMSNFPDAWSTLQRLATPPYPYGAPAPADTFQAMVDIARHPAYNVDEIYQQALVAPVYQPYLPAAPPAWTLAVKVNDTGERSPGYTRMFGGPANISWDARGYAWVANNVFQGTPNSGDFVVVLKPNGKPSDGTDGTPRSPVVNPDLVGPGYGVSVAPDGSVWVGSFGWGPESTFPTSGIVTKFVPGQDPLTAASYYEATERIQGTVVDAQGNVWMASYGNNAVVVYPGGNADASIVYPDESSPASPASMPFGIAVDPERPGTAWVTYGGGLGWPTAEDGYVARFALDLENGRLERTLFLQLGKALKGVTIDQEGYAWIASGGDDTVYVVTPDGHHTGFTSRGGILGPWGVAVDGNNDVWVANFGRMGVTENYTTAGISKLAGVGSPSKLAVGEALTPGTGYMLPTGGDPVTLPNGEVLMDEGKPCTSPLMRMTSVTLDQAGNIWAVNNWKPWFGSDFEPCNGDPGGDGIVIFVGLAKPPVR